MLRTLYYLVPITFYNTCLSAINCFYVKMWHVLWQLHDSTSYAILFLCIVTVWVHSFISFDFRLLWPLFVWRIVAVTHVTSPHLILFCLTSFQLNCMHCAVIGSSHNEPGSCAAKRSSLPWLQPITRHSVVDSRPGTGVCTCWSLSSSKTWLELLR